MIILRDFFNKYLIILNSRCSLLNLFAVKKTLRKTWVKTTKRCVPYFSGAEQHRIFEVRDNRNVIAILLNSRYFMVTVISY